MDTPENGAGGNSGKKVRSIMLELNPETGHLNIEMDCPSLDEALGILERARLMLDAKFRFQMGQLLLAENVRENAIQQAARAAMSSRGKA